MARARSTTAKHFSPPVPPGTPVTPAEHAAAKAKTGPPLNRADKRAARRHAKRAAAACPTTPSLPRRQENNHVTITADTKHDADPAPETAATQPRQTPPEHQKPDSRYCGGWEVVVDEAAITDAVGSDGHHAAHSSMRALLLIDGREVYGCASCEHWHADRDEVRAHLRTHTGRFTADADYLHEYLLSHGFNEGPFTASQTRADGLSRYRFPTVATVDLAMQALVADGRLTVVPGLVCTYTLATSQLAAEQPEQPNPAGAIDLRLLDGKSASTRRQYASAWARFVTWCQDRGRIALPCSDETLAQYVADRLASGPTASTVKMDMTAIATVHRCARIEAPNPAPARLALSGNAPPTAAPVEAGESAGEHPGDEPTETGDEQVQVGDHPGDDPGDDEPNGRLQAAAQLREQLVAHAGVPTPAQVAAVHVDVMTLPLSAIVNRANQVESYRVSAVKANDKAAQAVEAVRAAEDRAREAEQFVSAAKERAELAEERSAAAEERARAAEAALESIQAALGAVPALRMAG